MAASRKGKTALVLAGGGVSGVAYEVGALCALDHVFTNHTVNDFDLYVGTSAGAIVAACAAGSGHARTPRGSRRTGQSSLLHRPA